ncbi:sugar phosphate isomerase/epimerase family protein [Plantibacter sp. MPB07]|uniref:sugar phosphate isomerase/epimerase family protein n=1 Tax=Plantibacter sp. MPB07 TaxID=3388853 RepID=UPI003985D3B8
MASSVRIDIATAQRHPLTGYGVIVPSERIPGAFASGADYAEPTIVGNLIVADGAGWTRHPDYDVSVRRGSFAILFPGDLSLADPGFPAERVTAYLDAVMPIIGSVSEPGAKIVFGSGTARTIPTGVDVAAARARFAEVVVETRDTAERNGLQIVLEPLNRDETNLLNSLEETVAFLDEFGIDRVPVVADLFHIMLEEEPLAVVQALGARIGHAHIADAGRRPPGQGDWPLTEFITALRDGGYDGPITVECLFEDFEPELEAALAHLRRLA